MSVFDPSYEPRPGLTHRDADWSGLRVLVTGLGVSGFAAADALAERGAVVTVVEGRAPGGSPANDERAHILEILDIAVRQGEEHTVGMPSEPVDLVVTSPGWRPDQPLLLEAAARGIPVWGEVELAWRMRTATGSAPWLTVTGTNGKTTTVNMLATILRAAGLRATSAGNVGNPILEAVLHPEPFDVIAVELSSFQLHWQRSVAPVASACLNVAPDHLDWHGSFEEYLRAKGRVYANTHIACVYNVADPLTEQLVMDAKATNPHAAAASLRSFESVVWVAGGLLKGADVEELVEQVRGRLRGVVLIGVDRARIAEALARHAPDVPVVDMDPSETGDMAGVDLMDVVVARAAELAQPGDVVLLAPAAASMDMFANYGARGDAFAAAVRRLADDQGGR